MVFRICYEDFACEVIKCSQRNSITKGLYFDDIIQKKKVWDFVLVLLEKIKVSVELLNRVIGLSLLVCY